MRLTRQYHIKSHFSKQLGNSPRIALGEPSLRCQRHTDKGKTKPRDSKTRGGLRTEEEHHLPANATHTRQVKRTRGGKPGSGTGDASQPNATRRPRDSVTASLHPRPREQPGMRTARSPLAPPAVRAARSRTHLTKRSRSHLLLRRLHGLSTSPPGPAPNPPARPCRGAHGAGTPGVSHPVLHRPAAPASLHKRTQNGPEFPPTPVTLVPQQISTVTSHGR